MELLDLVMANWKQLLILTVSSFLVAIMWTKYRYEIGLFWIGIRQRAPLMGKVNRLSKKFTVTDNMWFNSERQVCQDWKTVYKQNDKNQGHYQKCTEYLEMVGESGRKPLTLVWVVGLFIVLLLEALGFSYTLAMFLDQGASENVRIAMSIVVAIMFAVALHFFTHKMGHEIYRNKIIDNIRKQWSEDRQTTGNKRTLVKRTDVGIGSIEKPSDLSEPSYIKVLNRLPVDGAKKSLFWTGITVATIILIGTCISGVRYYSNVVSGVNVATCTQDDSSDFNFGSVSVDTIYDGSDSVPQMVSDGNGVAKDQAKLEECQATENASTITIGTLAIVFIGLQIFATWTAINRGFAGEKSGEAYRVVKDFDTEEDYLEHLSSRRENVAEQAQKSLNKLQLKMSSYVNEHSHDPHAAELVENNGQRNFLTFVQMEHLKETQDQLRRQEIDHDASVLSARKQAKTDAQLNQVAYEKKADELASAKQSRALDKESNDDLMAELAALRKKKEAEAVQSVESPEEYANRMVTEFEVSNGLTLEDDERDMFYQKFYAEGVANA